MVRRIALLHTAKSNVAVFEASHDDLGLGSDVVLRHEVRSDLLADAEKAGGLTPEITRRTREALLALRDGADAVVLTCSTLGPSVGEAVRDATDVPMLRVDEALAREAVREGGKVVVLCAVETTIQPTRVLFKKAAQGTGSEVDVRLVSSAWAAFKGGDRDRYLSLVAEAADEAIREGASRVALAQASMAGAARLTREGSPPLTSPSVGLRAAIAAAAP
jgi:Asp/Glu/hydantoin racemase